MIGLLVQLVEFVALMIGLFFVKFFVVSAYVILTGLREDNANAKLEAQKLASDPSYGHSKYMPPGLDPSKK